MGIFEKSIPKYTYNMANEVVVAPQDVYVDDIFDPILNARVKAAMREKYGGGLYGVLGGYEELLKNTWTGREGILGPGMGLLSTFGRSMEKADDIVLGALTEGVKAMSFQGATNPLKNIFTNDYDYTGKGLLASVANIGSPLVGGTTVDESDFGGAWTVPALGIELGTDVGILGGGLARKFAPEVKEFTAKQLFENLGKSDLKTSVGTIGQLMSDYDDLMAKVAIDVSAPGLRPAMKGLMNRIATMVGHGSASPYANAQRDYSTGDGTANNGMLASLVQLFVNTLNKYKELPASAVDEFAAADKLPSEVMTEVTENSAFNNLKHAIISSQIPTKPVAKGKRAARSIWEDTDKALVDYDEGFANAVREFVKRAGEKDIDLSDLSIDKFQGLATDNLDEVHDLLVHEFLSDFDDAALSASETLEDVERRFFTPEQLEYRKQRGAKELEQAHLRPVENSIEWRNETAQPRDQIDWWYETTTPGFIEAEREASNRMQDYLWGGRDPVDYNALEESEFIALSKQAELTPYQRGLITRFRKLPYSDREAFVKQYEKHFKEMGRRIAWAKPERAVSPKKVFSPKKMFLTDEERRVLKLYQEAPSGWGDITKMPVNSDTKLSKNVILFKYKDVFKSIAEKQDYAAKFGSSSIPKSKIPTSLNKSYIPEFIDTLSTKEGLENALLTGEWTSNDAFNASVDAILYGPKYKNNPTVNLYSNLYTLSPSKYARLEKAGVPGLRAVRNRLKKAISVNSEEDLDKLLNSDEMTAALNAVLPPTDRGWYTNAVANFKNFDNSQQVERVEKFKELLKKVILPDETQNIAEYSKAVEELVDYVDMYWTSTARGTSAWNVLDAVPEEAEVLDKLYRALDSISQHYTQPIQNLPKRSLDFTGRRAELYFQNEANDFGIAADYGNYEAWAQAMFSKVAPYIDSEDTLRYFYEPFKPYMELKLKRNGKELYNPSVVKSAPEGKIAMRDVRDVAYDKSKNVVKRYISEVLPLYERYVSLGGNLFIESEFIPKGFSKADFEKLNAYFGKHGAVPDVDADDFNNLNKLFFPGYWKDIEKRGKFKAKRPIIEEGVSNNYYDIGKVLGNNVLSPTQLEDFVLSHEQMVKSRGKAMTYGNDVQGITREVQNVANSLRMQLPDIGIRDEHALKELLNKVDAKDLDTLRTKVNALNFMEKRKLHAYAILYESAMSKLPYRAIARSRHLVSADSGYQLLEGTVRTAMKGLDSYGKPIKKMSPRTGGRIRQLLNTEAEWHWAKGGSLPSVNKYSSDARYVLESLLPNESSQIYRDAVLSNMSSDFNVSRMQEFLAKFRSATNSDGVASATLRDREHKLLEYYTSQGKPHRMANTTVYDARDAICREYLGKSYRTNRNSIDEWISDYLEAEALDSARIKELESATVALGARNAYSAANMRYVKEHLISRLPNQYRSAWRPSPEKGLFYFDITDGEPASAMYVGETFEIRPGDFQRRLRSGKNYYELMKMPERKRPLTSYLDYSKLNSPTEVDRAARWLANRHIQMEYMATPYKTLADTTVEILEKPKTFKLTSENVAENVREIQETMVKASPEAAAEMAYEAVSTELAAVESALVQLIGEDAVKYLRDGGDPEGLKEFLPKEQWDLYTQITKANAVSSINSHRKLRATLRRKPVRALLERVFKLRGDHLMNGGKMSDFRRFVALRQQPHGDILKGEDFWNELRHSGMLGAVYAKGSKDADAVFDSLTKNAKLINDAAGENTVRVVMEEIPNDKVKVYLQFVYDKKGVIKINNAAEKLEKAAYETVVFSPPKAWTAEDLAFMNTPEMRQLAAYMDEAQVLANEQARYLGFAFDPNTAYTKHAMNRNVENAQWFSETFYKDFSSDDLDEFVNCISNLERYRKADHGSFGTVVNTRRFRGDVWMMDDGPKVRFNYDPYEMVTSTLADGAFANLQFQSYVDLFMNDNFKIKGIFNSVDELKEVLYKPLEDGSVSGNLRNLELCTMKLNADGKIIGLTKYDKLSDAGLAKALADENCILVPANAISHIDNLLKKDVRMSNKFWTFINKHFTIPFKFGVLSNPGFLLGNMSDAYLKLATTMSEKYGTTLKSEAARVAGCLKRAELYQEQYGNAFDVWRKVSADNGIKLSDEALVPGIVAMSPKYNEQFLDWLDGRLRVEKKVQDPITGKIETVETVVPCDLSDNVKDAAGIWVTLQTAQMNSDKLREFADLADLRNVSEFEMPTNWWTRITQGKGKYDKHKPSTWGVFMNNPYTSAMLDKSTGWEEVIRTASILDDLEHGYTLEELGALARGQKYTQADVNFRVRLDEAKNTMYNAQFDYERGSDFMEGVGKVVPFPVFFLKNFAYWMELFEKNPQYVDNAIDIQEGLWSNRDEEHSKDSFAIEAKGRGAIPVGGKALPDWFKGYYKPAPLQSMFGAFNLLNDPVGNMQYRVNPLVSGGVAAANKLAPNELTTSLAPTEETKYRPYSTNMYERNIKSSDPNFNPLEYTVHRMNPYERAMNTYLRTPDKVRQGEAQLSDFVPSVFQPDF